MRMPSSNGRNTIRLDSALLDEMYNDCEYEVCIGGKRMNCN